MNRCIDNTSISFPDDPLPNIDRDTPYLTLGYDTFTQRIYFMKPYGRRGLSIDMMVTNYNISRGNQSKVGNAFGILAICWGCFSETMEQCPDTVFLLVAMVAHLHNFMRIHCPSIGNAEVGQVEKTMN